MMERFRELAYTAIFVLVISTIFSLIVVQQSIKHFNTIRAKQVQIVDSRGNIVMNLGYHNGLPSVVIYGNDGSRMLIDERGSTFTSADGSYTTMVQAFHAPMIEFINNRERIQAAIVLNEGELRFLFAPSNTSGWKIERSISDIVSLAE